MEQTTSLRTKIYDSSLKWRIENFLDYGSCNIDSLTSETINFEHTDVQWTLTVYTTVRPSFEIHNTPEREIDFVLNIKDNEFGNSAAKRLFRAEIKVDLFGHQLMSPDNRHFVKSKGFFAEPDMNEPVVKVFDYHVIEEEAHLNGSLVFMDKKFRSYFDSGALNFYINVYMKTVEVSNLLKKP